MAHNELLLKLWNFGFTDSLWLWMKACLTNRLQFVSIGQSVSNTIPVISGVPQGSILGPLLFLIVVNDHPTAVSSSLVMLFADDAKCMRPISSLSDCICLKNDLTRLTEWCSTWSLFLNECSVVHFNSNQAAFDYKYCINGKLITSNSSQKDLDVIISAALQIDDI